MMSSPLGDVRNCTSMHAYTITEQDPRQVEASSMPIEFTTGAVGRRLQHPVWRRMRSHCRNPWNFYFNPTTWLTSAWRSYVISQLLTSLWSGGNNSMPGMQLNPQHPLPHQQCKPHPGWRRRTAQSRSDEEGHGRVSYRIDQGELMIKASTKELSFSNIKQELKAASTATTSAKHYQVFTQVFPKPATV